MLGGCLFRHISAIWNQSVHSWTFDRSIKQAGLICINRGTHMDCCWAHYCSWIIMMLLYSAKVWWWKILMNLTNGYICQSLPYHLTLFLWNPQSIHQNIAHQDFVHISFVKVFLVKLLCHMVFYVCMYVCTYVCMYVCMHVCSYVCQHFSSVMVTKTFLIRS